MATLAARGACLDRWRRARRSNSWRFRSRVRRWRAGGPYRHGVKSSASAAKGRLYGQPVVVAVGDDAFGDVAQSSSIILTLVSAMDGRRHCSCGPSARSARGHPCRSAPARSSAARCATTARRRRACLPSSGWCGGLPTRAVEGEFQRRTRNAHLQSRAVAGKRGEVSDTEAARRCVRPPVELYPVAAKERRSTAITNDRSMPSTLSSTLRARCSDGRAPSLMRFRRTTPGCPRRGDGRTSVSRRSGVSCLRPSLVRLTHGTAGRCSVTSAIS